MAAPAAAAESPLDPATVEVRQDSAIATKEVGGHASEMDNNNPEADDSGPSPEVVRAFLG